ncbi:MAG TPA: hypothetical protein VFU15_06025, partial [Bacteroidia bacterium]|nr:hypothetical protein [Bacteroidia bacterium]
PKGTYRDINNYYSIQNTFPEIFAVGPDSITANATDYQIAQSRQLKGYLTLFDQVLANQFTQLACVPRLFSFKNSMTAAPFDRRTYFEKKTSSERRQEKFPAPYLRFSPTYFCQSLYDIPNIKPLLKDNDTFDFSFGEEPQKVQERESWERYMLDPYNPYMHGLMKFMESDSTSYERRNAILDHLLARHGESPYVINMLIANSVYAGETMKDRVVFKSMYLQNLGLLTYNRAKGYNFLGADTLIRKDEQDISPPWKIPVPAHFEELIFTGETVDSVFNSRRANWEEKLDEQDFINYSGIELKLSLLFGMKATYDDLLTAVLLNDDADQTKNFPQPVEDGLSMSLWFITRRRGFIFLETLLLLQNFEYQVTLCTQQKTAGTWQCYNVSGTETYDAVKLIIRTLIVQDNATLSGWVSDGKFSTCGMTFSITSGEDTNHYGQQIPGTDFSIVVTSLPLQQITLCTQQKTEGTWYCYNISGPQTAATVQLVTATLQSAGNSMIAGWISAGEMTAGDITYPISPAPDTGQYGEPVTGTHYNLLVTNDASPDASLALNYSCFDDDLQLIFPDYIPQFAEPSFRLMTQLFMENELPEELSYGFYLAGFTSLQPLVTNFIYWHESLRYKSSYAANSAVYAKGVLSAVNSLITPVPNAAN